MHERRKWDERYGSDEYYFGKDPNDFFKEEIDKLNRGKILLIGDGEGRNSVYAAKLGWQVDSIDISPAGKQKALSLAAENNVEINYIVEDAIKYEYPENCYDAVAIIYFHVKEELRELIDHKILNSLKNNGSIIMIVFAKEHLKNKNGGPSNPERLYELSDIAESFIDLEFKLFRKEKSNRNKGGIKQESTVIKFGGTKSC
jgi:SAM-dependent methyltransferase